MNSYLIEKIHKYEKKMLSSLPVFKKAKGSFLYDLNGNKYLDLYLANGSNILGNSYKKLTSEFKNRVSSQYSFGLLTIHHLRFLRIINQLYSNFNHLTIYNDWNSFFNSYIVKKYKNKIKFLSDFYYNAKNSNQNHNRQKLFNFFNLNWLFPLQIKKIEYKNAPTPSNRLYVINFVDTFLHKSEKDIRSLLKDVINKKVKLFLDLDYYYPYADYLQKNPKLEYMCQFIKHADYINLSKIMFGFQQHNFIISKNPLIDQVYFPYKNIKFYYNYSYLNLPAAMICLYLKQYHLIMKYKDIKTLYYPLSDFSLCYPPIIKLKTKSLDQYVNLFTDLLKNKIIISPCFPFYSFFSPLLMKQDFKFIKIIFNKIFTLYKL